MIRSDFKDSKLKGYFKADNELGFTHLVIPQMDATVAPKAFEAGRNVKGSGWIVKYQGQIASTKTTGTYRFVGQFDDIMLVFVDGKLVLNGGWAGLGHPLKKYKKNTPRLIYPNKPNNGPQAVAMRTGKYVKLEPGSEIIIIIGESPGGLAGGGLFIQEKGKEYKTNKYGSPILPPFCAQPLTAKDIKRLKAISYFPMELDDVPVFRFLE